ncbi:MAG TPA: hypothetical protein VNQ48_09260 [Microbacteriaceae bacterium]|nr:hypothetical protein [Microbacteriaceae bacterium]
MNALRALGWIAVGVAVGFVVAHQVSRTEQGRRFFDEVDSKAKEFGAAVVDGYKSREAELRAAVAEAEEVIADLAKRAKG